MRHIENPKNRFVAEEIAWDDGEAPLAQLHVHEERCKTIVSENRSPDLHFRFSINPYRGCQHACAYCYARPSHQYWGFGAGTDFEREIVVKINAPELLREALARPSWQGHSITFSGNTDCYQPLEGRYQLTRQLLAICLEYRNPVAIITKSALIQRDLALLRELHAAADVQVFVSIPFADDANGRALEPGAPAIHRRFETLRALSDGGIETGVAVAPIIPGLNDSHVGEILKRAKAAGARHAFHTMLRLPAEVKPVFLSRLQQTLPDRAAKVEHAIREARGGGLYDSRFGDRMRGQGPRWSAIDELFKVHVKRLGLQARLDTDADSEADLENTGAPQPRPARPNRQLQLFDANHPASHHEKPAQPRLQSKTTPIEKRARM